MKKRNVYVAATLRSRRTSCLLGSDNSVYLVTALARASTHILLLYAPQNIRYTQTLYEIHVFLLA